MVRWSSHGANQTSILTDGHPAASRFRTVAVARQTFLSVCVKLRVHYNVEPYLTVSAT